MESYAHVIVLTLRCGPVTLNGPELHHCVRPFRPDHYLREAVVVRLRHHERVRRPSHSCVSTMTWACLHGMRPFSVTRDSLLAV